MPGVNDWINKWMFHPTLPPKTAFKEEVYESLKLQGYSEGYRKQEYPKAMYPPNYHTNAKQVINKHGEFTGEWLGLRTITVKDLAAEVALKKKGWLDHMPALPENNLDNFEVVEDFADPQASEAMKKADAQIAAQAARNAAAQGATVGGHQQHAGGKG